MRFYLLSWFRNPFFNSIARALGLSETALLPADSRQAKPLTIVVAIMCGLGCIAALTARIGFRAADTWTSELKSAITILVEAPRDEQNLARAVAIARQTKGVKSANAMDKNKAKELLKNYGANIGALLDELPLPSLIEVGLEAGSKDTAKNIETQLQSLGYKFAIDDHSRYSGEIVRTSAVLRVAALLALLSLMIAAVASIAFAARAALQTQSEAVQILHLVGAEDEFVVHEVQARFTLLGLISGFYGALGAGVIVTAAILLMGIGNSSLTSGTSLLKWWDIWVLIIAPFICAIASALAARIAARETLKDLV
jgi:cell division transport system permease protein